MTCTICHKAIKSGDLIAIKGPHAPKGGFGLHTACLQTVTGLTYPEGLTGEYNEGAAPAPAPAVTFKGAKLVTPKGKTTVSSHLAKLASQGLPEVTPKKVIPTISKAATPKPFVGEWKQQMAKGPKTQKAKGIKTLQDAAMLSAGYAKVALTEAEAVAFAKQVGLPCFCRPCPITPRHGFVDSRVVKTEADVVQVWAEARAADPQAELILMPFIQASHNMVWRPGLLSVGPGHDGATAGHESVSIFLQPEYSGSWKTLATKAGCDLSVSDPFIEAVASGAHETVLTQIRAGVKGAPTAPDWIPQAMTVANVITIDQAAKSEPEAMLKWETTAKGLKAGADVVYNPGGNLGDHWSVHAQLHNIAVVTSFKPSVGQQLVQTGDQLVELEPQAIVFGFLGGLLTPDLTLPLMRKRAVCAALLGSHHGMRMGGDAGVFIGASVALMLRLAQAALWGESRHAKNPGHLSRDQIYKSVLNDWLKGREGLYGKISLFWTHSWGSGFGGMKWAACAKATVELDAAMLELVRTGSRQQAKQVLAVLTNVVNLAHNNGWWLNKFCTSDWFNLAADLDPRVAIMAGPAWYDAATADPAARMQLLTQIEAMKPIDVSKLEAKHGVASLEAATVKGKKKAKATAATGSDPDAVQMSDSHHGNPFVKPTGGKIQTFGITAGDVVKVFQPPVKACCKVTDSDSCHLQIGLQTPEGAYAAGEVGHIPPDLMALIKEQPTTPTLSGSGTKYQQLELQLSSDQTWLVCVSGGSPIAAVQLTKGE